MSNLTPLSRMKRDDLIIEVTKNRITISELKKELDNSRIIISELREELSECMDEREELKEQIDNLVEEKNNLKEFIEKNEDIVKERIRKEIAFEIEKNRKMNEETAEDFNIQLKKLKDRQKELEIQLEEKNLLLNNVSNNYQEVSKEIESETESEAEIEKETEVETRDKILNKLWGDFINEKCETSNKVKCSCIIFRKHVQSYFVSKGVKEMSKNELSKLKTYMSSLNFKISKQNTSFYLGIKIRDNN